MKLTGFAFHCHHDRLWEYVYDFAERVAYIRTHKPQNEQELRLKLFKLIPDDRMPGRDSAEWKVCDKASKVSAKAWEDYNKASIFSSEAWDVYDKVSDSAEWDSYDKASDAYVEAWDACDKAWEVSALACDKAWEAWKVYAKAFAPQIEALHKELCPDCTWNGKTIFPNKQESN